MCAGERVKKYSGYIFQLMSGQASQMKFAKYCEALFKPRFMFTFQFSKILIWQMVSFDEFVTLCKLTKTLNFVYFYLTAT